MSYMGNRYGGGGGAGAGAGMYNQTQGFQPQNVQRQYQVLQMQMQLQQKIQLQKMQRDRNIPDNDRNRPNNRPDNRNPPLAQNQNNDTKGNANSNQNLTNANNRPNPVQNNDPPKKQNSIQNQTGSSAKTAQNNLAAAKSQASIDSRKTSISAIKEIAMKETDKTKPDLNKGQGLLGSKPGTQAKPNEAKTLLDKSSLPPLMGNAPNQPYIKNSSVSNHTNRPNQEESNRSPQNQNNRNVKQEIQSPAVNKAPQQDRNNLNRPNQPNINSNNAPNQRPNPWQGQDGRQEVRPEGRQEVRPEGRPEGRQEVRPEGRQEVRPEGRQEVRLEGRQDQERGAKPEGGWQGSGNKGGWQGQGNKGEWQGRRQEQGQGPSEGQPWQGGRPNQPGQNQGGRPNQPGQNQGGRPNQPGQNQGGRQNQPPGQNQGGRQNQPPGQNQGGRPIQPGHRGGRLEGRLEQPGRPGQKAAAGNFMGLKFYNADKISNRVNQSFATPLIELGPLDISEKKFNCFARLFIGNLPKNYEQSDLVSMFEKFGEIGSVYVNKDSSFAFINMDLKANAAKAMRELDNSSIKNRYIKVRFATVSEGIRVKNLSPYASNELLEKAFEPFGVVEHARAVVDDRGNPKGEGIIIFRDKKMAFNCVKKCQDDCYFLSGAMRPVVVVPLEPFEDNIEGFYESMIPKNMDFHTEREVVPHFADPNSFEFEFGQQWKQLFSMYEEKKSVLDRDFQIEIERLEKKMVLAKVEYEAEKLRKELAEREAESAQLRRHFEYTNDGMGSTSIRPASPPMMDTKMTATGSGNYDPYSTEKRPVEQGYESTQYNNSYENYDRPGYNAGEYDRSYGAYNREGGYPREGTYTNLDDPFDRTRYEQRSADLVPAEKRPAAFEAPAEPAFPNNAAEAPNKRPRY